MTTTVWTLFAAGSFGAAGSLMFGWHKDTPQYMSADNPWSLANTAAERDREAVQAVENSVNYSGCNEARAAGAAPIYAGQPGYRANMDGDSDGIACEPYR